MSRTKLEKEYDDRILYLYNYNFRTPKEREYISNELINIINELKKFNRIAKEE